MGRVGEDLAGGPVLDQLTVREHRDAVRGGTGEVDVMRRDEEASTLPGERDERIT